MGIAFYVVSLLAFIASLPVVIELSVFLFSNLFLRSTRRQEEGASLAAISKIAVLIPAHDEESCIERCIASVLSSDAGPYRREVIVVADNCRDPTAALATRAGARVIERFSETERGKGAALNYAISLLDGEDFDAYIIVDADSVVSGDFVRIMGDNFDAGKEAVQCVYLALNVEASPKIRLMNLSLLSMNVFRPRGREIIGCSVGIMGNGFGLKKELLREVPYTANSITEDLEYHLKLIERGRRVRFVPKARVLADFPVSKEGSETQRARWEGGRFLLQREFALRLLSSIFSGRAAMIEPFLELMSLPLSYEVVMLLLLVFLPAQPFLPYALGGLAVIAAQIIASVLLYGTRRDFLALFEIPKYLFWKVINLPRILLASRKGAKWIRTKRD
jgi:cellulose synthase/poly-beta-1,6-N-acetylglucosamine synthase-like glycosyltransferase